MKIKFEQVKKWIIEDQNNFLEIKEGDIVHFTVNDNCAFADFTWNAIHSIMAKNGFLTGFVSSLSATKIEIKLQDKEFYNGTYFTLKHKNLASISLE